MKHPTPLLLLSLLTLLLLLCSCHTSRTSELEKLNFKDSTFATSMALDASYMDSLFSENHFRADKLTIELLPSGGARMEAEGVERHNQKGRISELSAKQKQSENASHKIRDSTSVKKEKEAVIVTEPPDTNHLTPYLAVSVSVIAIAYLALKMRR